MNSGDRTLMIEQAAAAWRQRARDGGIRSHPAWHDLDEAGREEAYETTRVLRLLESAMDARGLSGTGHAVMNRIERSSEEER